ncbi:MAG: hypothetical protein AAF502_18430 [Bacteroidota bacterium]
MAQLYQTEVAVDVTYELPDTKILNFPPPKTIYANLTSGGWSLMFRYLSGNNPNITIPLDDSPLQIISPRQQESLISKALNDQFQVENKTLENITLELDEVYVKKVPISLRHKIRLAPQYQFADSLTITPDSVEVIGPAIQVAGIERWETALFSLENVDASSVQSIPVKDHPNEQIRFAPAVVTSRLNVEQYTEKSFEVPIEVYGVTDSSNIILFQRKLSISFNVGLTDYEEINPDDFQVVADFSALDFENSTFAPLRISKSPKAVSNIRYQPAQVEFLRKK